MITKYNSAAYSSYTALFDKINNALGLTDEDGDNAKIADLGDYFMELEKIRDAVQNRDTLFPDADPSFLILPIDEGIFEIDANTRKINVPTDFAKNGVGVQGDELAEIVYFSIDRYFDLTDFYDDNLGIYIQWEAPDGTKGLSVAINKTIDFIDNKVVFGWIISNEMTAAPGNIKFSVRFFTRKVAEDGTSYLSYSFSTLAATVKVNSGLDIDISSAEDIEEYVIDKSNLYYQNMRNSAADNVVEPAATPIFDELTPDLDGEYELGQVFSAHAKFSDNTEGYSKGTITYTWEHTNKAGYVSNVDATGSYEAIADNATQDLNDIYYYEDENTPGLFLVYDTNNVWDERPTLYRLFSKTAEAAAAGYYRVKAKNFAGRGNSATATSDRWYVAFASIAEIDLTTCADNLWIDEDGMIYVQVTGGSTKIVPTIEAGKDSIKSTTWYFNDTEFSTDQEIDVDDTEGTYYLKVVTTRNGDEETAESSKIFVCREPMNPEVVAFLIDGVESGKYTETQGETSRDYYRASVGDTISFNINYLEEDHEGVTSYQWYKDGVAVEGAINKEFVVPFGSAGSYFYLEIINSRKGFEAAPVKTLNIEI